MGYGCSAPDPGTYEATAAARLVDGALMFHPFIHTSSGDCEDSGWASVMQNANFTRAAPDRLFHVQRVLVEMSGTGHGYAHLGGYGFWQNPNPAYDHTRVKLSLYLEQYVPGNEFGGAWPINDRPVLLRNGDYNQAITIEAEQAEFGYYLQGKQDGGGDLFCFLRLDTQATALGSDARVHIDFSEESGFYIRVNGILLIGNYV